MKHVAVAMSGGVDSSVAAYLLKQQGYQVTGLFMSLGACLEKLVPKQKSCCSIYDASDAQKVAKKLGIDFLVLDFKVEFERLINYFVQEYNRGQTPNPCIRCNQWLKFGKLWEYAQQLGADYIATGHYARIEPLHNFMNLHTYKSRNNYSTNKLASSPRYLLKKGIDSTKDQSYVLFSLTQEQLSRIILPLGNLTKLEVRKIARQIDLPVQDKLESQEICFVPGRGRQALTDFLKSRIPEHIKKGEIRDLSGKVVGLHPGYQLFTIGQRHGLKIALGKPVYVIKIIPETNTIIIGDKHDLYQKSLIAEEVNWILSCETPLLVEAKIRYLHKPAQAYLYLVQNLREEYMEPQVRLDFLEPQPAITPGQAVVFYQGDIVLGGGWIKNVIS